MECVRIYPQKKNSMISILTYPHVNNNKSIRKAETSVHRRTNRRASTQDVETYQFYGTKKSSMLPKQQRAFYFGDITRYLFGSTPSE